MAVSTELIECVICSENLLDPRALPCGHSFCGPPRCCLTGLKNSTGGICCAICRVDHDLKPEAIKPLYGIRDYLLKNQTSPDIPCLVHTSKECTFRCLDCELMICFECTEDEHDGHFVRNLKKHLIAKVESLFGKSWRHGIAKYRESLEKMRASQKFELENQKTRMEEIEKQLQAVQLQMSVIDSCLEPLSHNNDEKRVSETLSLLKLSNLELLERRNSGLEKTVDKLECSTQCNTACCEISTQYEILTRSVSSQSDSELACVRKSTASQTDALLSVRSTSITERNGPSANCSSGDNEPDQKHKPLSDLRYERRGTSDSSDSWTDEEPSDDEMLNCYCMLKHKKVSNWNFTICLGAELRVSDRNPLVIGRSNFLFVCPFKFWVRAELVPHKYKHNEKVFKIIVGYRKANKDYGDLPAASIFRYAFILANHNKDGVHKKYEGTWYYPKHKELYWHSITSSQLINPESGWINSDNDVIVEIELIKLA